MFCIVWQNSDVIDFEHLFPDVVGDTFTHKVHAVVVHIVVMAAAYCSTVDYILACYKIRKNYQFRQDVKYKSMGTGITNFLKVVCKQ